MDQHVEYKVGETYKLKTTPIYLHSNKVRELKQIQRVGEDIKLIFKDEEIIFKNCKRFIYNEKFDENPSPNGIQQDHERFTEIENRKYD